MRSQAYGRDRHALGLRCQHGIVKFLDLDANQWLAILTAALVIVTAVYVVLTSRLASHAEASAKSAAVSAKSAERALLLQAMPFYYPSEGISGGLDMKVAVTCLVSKPAFKLQVSVEQLGKEELGGQAPYLLATPGEDVFYDLPTEHDFRWHQPYTARLTYLDATGTAYRTQRIGYIDGNIEVTAELWDEENQEWVTLV